MSNYNFKSLTQFSKFRSWKDWSVGEFVIGKLVDIVPNTKNPKNNDLILEVLELGFKMDGVTVGSRFSVNGCASVQRAIDAGIEENDIVRVEYRGQETVKTGQWKGTKTHVIEVSVAKDKNVTTTEEDSDLLG
jgi:hypothetical protein